MNHGYAGRVRMDLMRRHAVLPWGKVGQFGRPLRYAVTTLADLDAAGADD